MKGPRTILYDAASSAASAVKKALPHGVVEHFQNPDADRGDYTDVLEEVDDQFRPTLKDLQRLREFDEAVEKVSTDRADDIIKPWFTLVPVGGAEIPDDLQAAFEDWSNRTYRDTRNPARRYNLKQIYSRALDYTNWSGNGIILKNYDDVSDENIGLLKGLKGPVSDDAIITGYQVLPRLQVFFDDKHEDTVFYTFNNTTASSIANNKGGSLSIHPTRITDLVLKDDPRGSWLGQSLVQAAIMLIIAKFQTSNDVGHMLARILPKHILSVQSANESVKTSAKAAFKGITNRMGLKLPKGVDYDIKGYSGKLIDLTAMYDIFYQALAIAADMPLDFLKGVSAGMVTGSNVNSEQYFKSIHSDQVRLEPCFKDEFLDFARRNHGVTLPEGFNFKIKWGSVAAPNKNDEARQRLWNSNADKNLFDAGLSLETVNEDRLNFGVPALEGTLSETTQTTSTRKEITSSPFLDTYGIEEDAQAKFEALFEKIAAEIQNIFDTGSFTEYQGKPIRMLHQLPEVAEMERIVDSFTGEAIEISRVMHTEGLLAGNRKGFAALGRRFNRQFPDVTEVEWMNQRGGLLVKDVSETLKTDINRVLLRSAEGGLSPDTTSRAIRDIIGSKARADRIARTEILTASSFSRHRSHRELGVLFKTWTTARDEKVRDTHSIDGETVKIDETFSNGLLHPGDPSAPPEEVVNCRCAEAPSLRRQTS